MNYKEQYVEAYRKYIRRDGAASLLNWLMTTDFFEAPASTKYHGNFPGGLALHSLNVFERMRNNCVYEFGAECGGAEPFPEEDLEPIAIVALLHDICKAEFYKQDFRNQKIYSEHGTQFDKRGAYSWESIPFYTVEEKFPLGHGEKSVFLINEETRRWPFGSTWVTLPTAILERPMRCARWRCSCILRIFRRPIWMKTTGEDSHGTWKLLCLRQIRRAVFHR